MPRLKNAGETLPLDISTKKTIALIGPNADNKDHQLGDYNPDAAISEAAGMHTVTVLEAFSKLTTTNPQLTLKYSYGADISLAPPNRTTLDAALKLHREADVTVLVVGDSTANSNAAGSPTGLPGEPGGTFGKESCGEGADRNTLDLYGQQMGLLQQLASSNSSSKLVVVLIHGRQTTFGPGNSVLEKVDALLAAWRPGAEGGNAIVDIITGAVNPSGHTTQAWPADTGQINSLVNPWYQSSGEGINVPVDGGIDAAFPLFPFGFGLSYTTFSFGQPALSSEFAGTMDTISVTVPVSNTGKRDGCTVVQLYSEAPIAIGLAHYQRTLVGFTKVRIRNAAIMVHT